MVEKKKLLEKIYYSKIIKNGAFAFVVLFLIAILFPNLFNVLNINSTVYILLFFNFILVISSYLNSLFKRKYFYKYINKEYKYAFLKYFITILAIFLVIFFVLMGLPINTNLKEISILISFVSLASFALDEIYHSL